MELLANPYTPKPGDVSGGSFLQLDAPSIDGIYTIELEIRKPPRPGKGYPLFWLWIGDTPGRGWKNTPAYVVYRGNQLRLRTRCDGKELNLGVQPFQLDNASKDLELKITVGERGTYLFNHLSAWTGQQPDGPAHIWLGGVGAGEQLAEHVTWKSVKWEPLGQVEPIPEDPSDGAEIMRIAQRMLHDAAALMHIGERLGGRRE